MMSLEDAGEAIQEVMRALHKDLGSNLDGVFLYAEVVPGMIAAGVYRDLNSHVVCYLGSTELFLEIERFWEVSPEDKRWAAMFLTISGDQFDARFQYPDGDWDPEESYDTRLDRVIAAKYGNKRIEYPKIDTEPGPSL